MARPIKKGLDYFPVDTDIFENIQVRKLKSRFKAPGFLVYFTILCDVYKKEGYFLQLSDDYVYDLSDRIGETEERVLEVIEFCLQTDLFNRQKYELYKVITSKSIQVRYIQAQKRCKNPVREELDCINVTETPVIVAETTENTTESAHIILDNNIVNKTKLNTQQQQQRVCEEKEPENLDEEREQWKDTLLADEEWRATIVRYAGKGTAVLQYAREAMAVFDDFLRLKFRLDTIRTKKDYSQSFTGWWRYHNFNLRMEELSGGVPQQKTISQMRSSRGQPERISRVEEIMELGHRSTELALKLYNQAI